MKQKLAWMLMGICLVLTLGACGAQPVQESSPASTPVTDALTTAAPNNDQAEETQMPAVELANMEESSEIETPAEEKETLMLQMLIGETAVAVDWEENESVEALKELCQDAPLTIQMSMYGGFEQVGSIGTSLPRNDVQTTTGAGDIVLYSGNQLVVFYGTNSWAYTRLGHISDRSAADMAALLGNGNVTITLSLGADA